MAAVCSSCGVAVVPGYVRCPKCHATLRSRPSSLASGTALAEPRKFPLIAVLAAAAIGAALIIVFGVLGNDDKPAVAKPPAPVETSAPMQPAAPVPAPATAPAPRGPDPDAHASDLERILRKRRLWSTVNVVGARVEVRSGSCSDPAMAPLVDAAMPGFKAAGLTELRCVEQSGRVVSKRDL